MAGCFAYLLRCILCKLTAMASQTPPFFVGLTAHSATGAWPAHPGYPGGTSSFPWWKAWQLPRLTRDPNLETP